MTRQELIVQPTGRSQATGCRVALPLELCATRVGSSVYVSQMGKTRARARRAQQRSASATASKRRVADARRGAAGGDGEDHAAASSPREASERMVDERMADVAPSGGAASGRPHHANSSPFRPATAREHLNMRQPKYARRAQQAAAATSGGAAHASSAAAHRAVARPGCAAPGGKEDARNIFRSPACSSRAYAPPPTNRRSIL